MARFLLAVAVILVLVAVDWRWRNESLQILAPILRIALGLTVALWLLMSTSLTPAYRHALVASDPVTTMRDLQLTPYQSGVLTMERDAARVLRRVIPPLLILTWLGAFPAVGAVRRAFKVRHKGDESMSDVRG